MNRGRGRGNFPRNNFQGQVIQTNNQKNTNNACFECGQEGHYTRNCPKKQRSQARLIDFDDSESYTPTSRVANIKAELASMTTEEKDQFIQEMDGKQNEDFSAV
jgi:hypothetical protein